MSNEVQGQSGGLDLASPRVRAFAWVIDWVLATVAIVIVGFSLFALGLWSVFGGGPDLPFDPLVGPAFGFVASYFLWELFVVGMIVWSGQSPGKMVTNLYIVDVDGKSPNVWRASLRELGFKFMLYTAVSMAVAWPFDVLKVPVLSSDLSLLLLLSLGLFVGLIKDANHQTLHDKVSGTFVVRAKPGRTATDE